jgi:hypothetical protein
LRIPISFNKCHAAGWADIYLFTPDENSEYTLEQDGHVIATGGYVWNYNFPYIDLHNEVKEEYRKKGYGALIVQELKKEAYRLGRVPAARCNMKNTASKRTPLKAGMQICGHILVGEIT